MRSERSFRVRKDELSELRPLSRWALQLADGRGLTEGARYDIDLCLHEAVVNIIRHGCDDGREHQVTVRFEESPTWIKVQVEDDARPFDPLTVPFPPEPTSLEDTPTDGRGIPLLRKLTREIGYDHAGGRNILTLVFARGQGSGSPAP